MLVTAKTHHSSSPPPAPRWQDHPLLSVIHLMSSPIRLQMSQPPGCPAPPVDTWLNGGEIILISHSISANQIASHVTSLICKHPVHILMGFIMSDLHNRNESLPASCGKGLVFIDYYFTCLIDLKWKAMMKKFLNTQKLGCCFLYSGIFVYLWYLQWNHHLQSCESKSFVLQCWPVFGDAPLTRRNQGAANTEPAYMTLTTLRSSLTAAQ